MLKNNILEIRKKKGITQKQIANAVGTTPHFISKLELGISNPSLTKAFEIARFLECGVEELYSFEDDK